MPVIRNVDLHATVAAIIGDSADDFDVDAIAAECFTFTGDGFEQTAGEVEFWASVAAHPAQPAPEPAAPVDVFRSEMVAVMKAAPVGQSAVWRRDGVTVTVVRHSRVNFEAPTGNWAIEGWPRLQPLVWGPQTWGEAWGAVESALDERSQGLAGVRQQLKGAALRVAAADQAAVRAKAAQRDVILQASAAGLTDRQIGEVVALTGQRVSQIRAGRR